MANSAAKVKQPRKSKEAPKVIEPSWSCEFCKKDFVREKSLINHMCEKKRRWLWRDEKYIRIGFMAFQKFYTLSLRSKKEKTYSDFMESQYFTAFTKFGRYIEHIGAIEVAGFVEMLIKSNIKLDDWTNEIWYESWIRELTKKESPMKAVERNILLMEQWGREYDENWVDFFRKVPTAQATTWIRKGRISPWLLYCGVGQPLFDRMSDEQLGMVKEWINPMVWNSKIRDNAEEVKEIKMILEEAGV
jgi:hypothetical protein